jgi:hypothetical protein
MRIAALLVGLVLLPASHLLAAPVVFLEFLNSDFTFGTVNPDQTGYDLSSLVVGSVSHDFYDWGSAYELRSGALVQQTLDINGSGEVIGSHYFYTGGTFELFFLLETGGSTIAGSFVAPIKTLTVAAGEAEGESARASYVLGPGLFDKAVAEALGIGRHTIGGEASSQLLLTANGGDHATPERLAWDGVNDITLAVPEPAMLALLGTGAAALSFRRRQG